MRKLLTAVLIAALGLLAACAETGSTVLAPDSAPQDSRGGVGNPHFVEDASITYCTFDTSTGRLTCHFRIAGLGKDGQSLDLLEVSMAGALTLRFTCSGVPFLGNVNVTSLRTVVGRDGFVNRSGHYTSSMSDRPTVAPICVFGTLDQNSVSYQLGIYGLAAKVITAGRVDPVFLATVPPVQ